MNKRGKFLKTSVLNLIKASVVWFCKYQLFVTLFVYILMICLLVVVDCSYELKLFFVLFFGLWVLIDLGIYLEYKRVELKEDMVFPKFSKRYTHTVGDNIYIKPEEWQDAILYLYYVEDYLENVGVYNKGE